MIRLIHVCVVIGLSWTVASTVRGEQPVITENAVLESFFREYLEEAFRLEPLMATRLGDHRFDSRARRSLRPGAKRHARTRSQATLADLRRKVQKEKLSRDGQIDYEIFRTSPGTHHLAAPKRFTVRRRPAHLRILRHRKHLSLVDSVVAPEGGQPQNALSRMAKIPKCSILPGRQSRTRLG